MARYLSKLTLSWDQASSVAERWRTALAPPHNPWFLDLPIEWVPALLDALPRGIIEAPTDIDVEVNTLLEDSWMRFKGAAKGWQASAMDKLQPETIPPLNEMETIGLDVKPEEPILTMNSLKDGPSCNMVCSRGLASARRFAPS